MAINVNLATGDILAFRVFCWCQARSQVAINVLHREILSVSGGSPQMLDLSAIALAAKTLWVGEITALLTEECHFLGVEVQRVFPTVSLTGFDTSPAVVGEIENEMMPAQVSGLIRTYTDEPGRRGRGRTYVPFPSEGQNDSSGQPTAGYVAALQDLADVYSIQQEFTDGVRTIDTRFGVFSNGNVLYPAVSVIGLGKWATQRRRGMFGSINSLPEWVPLPLPEPA